ncbi:MAG: GntR family transcriptional regulator [Anaerolineae bacterium]|nr:GntR family transcriptional regulator [Anaerolineae bacterium]
MVASLSPISTPVSREQQAYERIKEAILTFRLKPGQSLVENELAGQLGISKTPVRDALLRLEREGLVNRALYKGASVAELNQRKMEEIFEIRAALEGLAVYLATPLITAEETKEAQKLIDAQAAALAAGDVREASRVNRLFHELVICKTPNQWLKDILANLEDHLRRYRMISSFQGDRMDKSIKEHQLVLDAIRRGDAEGAEKAMREHLMSVLNDLVQLHDFDEIIKRIAEEG